jgi:predicted PhzF superfamily epimerase YddE/YHI9
MSPVEIDVVRVFTDEAGNFGNELGIIRATDATTGREQRIATDLGFSETVFIEFVAEGRATIRIFTPAAELPFAGHPSVGTAWWLAQGGTPVDVLVEGAGDVTVRYDGDLTWITGEAEWAPEFTWQTATSVAEVDGLDPESFTSGKHYIWAWENEAEGGIRSRMFAPALGVPEDQATGAAAVRLTALLERDLEIRQGLGCAISTRLLGEGRIEVGGRTVFDRMLTL